MPDRKRARSNFLTGTKKNRMKSPTTIVTRTAMTDLMGLEMAVQQPVGVQQERVAEEALARDLLEAHAVVNVEVRQQLDLHNVRTHQTTTTVTAL